MIQVKINSIMAFVISAIFLVASTSAFTEDQKQNRIDDRDIRDSGQQSQSGPSSKVQNDQSVANKALLETVIAIQTTLLK